MAAGKTDETKHGPVGQNFENVGKLIRKKRPDVKKKCGAFGRYRFPS
jgi:hypothetical protein